MTLNGVMAVISRYFVKSGYLGHIRLFYVTVVEAGYTVCNRNVAQRISAMYDLWRNSQRLIIEKTALKTGATHWTAKIPVVKDCAAICQQ